MVTLCPIDKTVMLAARTVEYGDHKKEIENCPVCGFGVISKTIGTSSTRLDNVHKADFKPEAVISSDAD